MSSDRGAIGGRQKAGLAEALADGFLAQNCGELDQVAWLIEHPTSDNTRKRLLVQFVERGQALGPTLDAVSRARGHFDSDQVFEALVYRAGREADQGGAQAALDATRNWSTPGADANSDARASPDEVVGKYPELQEPSCCSGAW